MLYLRLGKQCKSVGKQVIQKFRDGDWRDVADRIDWVKVELHELGAAREYLSESELLARSEKLLIKLAVVSRDAGAVIQTLDEKLSKIQKTVDSITVVRNQLKPSLPTVDTESEQEASWLLDGWKTAKKEVEQIPQTMEQLQVDVYGEVFLQRMLDKNDQDSS
jgi:hypothetical protein